MQPKMRIHAETTEFNMTVFDANVNMLRTQTEAMSATIAGVDSLTVLPYDISYKTWMIFLNALPAINNYC